MSEKFRWEVPDTSINTSTGYIHGNTKAHLFNVETGKSVCRQYESPTYHSECSMASYEKLKYDGNDEHYCKKCLKKYKKMSEVE